VRLAVVLGQEGNDILRPALSAGLGVTHNKRVCDENTIQPTWRVEIDDYIIGIASQECEVY
jgi:hypothetical protein